MFLCRSINLVSRDLTASAQPDYVRDRAFFAILFNTVRALPSASRCEADSAAVD